MKKTSIFLTAALIVVAILAGCSDTVAITGLPQNVKSGTINQIGDFLTGQTFDPKKFTVDITYDNGQVITDDGSVTVQLDRGNTVKRGSTVSANIGQNVDGIDVYATGSVAVYDINRIEVTGPAEIASETDGTTVIVPASALTVTAYYLDSENAEQSMVLSSGEYTVDEVNLGTNVKLSAAYPSQATSVVVTPQVGQVLNASGDIDTTRAVTGTFSFTATYPTAAPEKEIAKINSVEWKTGDDAPVLLALDYGTVPAPSFADVTVNVQYVDGTSGELKADPGITFKYVDDETGRDLTATKLSASMKLDIVATYGELTAQSETAVSPVTANLRVKPVAGFDALVTGEPIGEADPADFIVDLYYTKDTATVYTYLDSDDVEVIYTEGRTTEAIDPATTVGEEGAQNILAYATYMGAKGYTEDSALTPVTVDVVPVSITAEIDTAKYKAPAKQYYYSSAWGTAVTIGADAVKNVTVVDSEGESSTPTPSLRYSLTDGEYTPLVPEGYEADKTLGYDVLADVDTIYIEVSYTETINEREEDEYDVTVATYLPVELVTPSVETITLNREYDVTLGDNANAPLYNTGITWSVTTVNKNGYIDYEADIDTDVYGILVNNKEANALPTRVDNEADVTASIYTLSTEKANSSKDVTVNVGADYIPANEENSIEVDFADTYTTVIKVDDPLNFNATDFVASGYESAKGEATGVTVVKAIIPTGQMADEENTINVAVKFTDATGEEKQILVPVEFTALSYSATPTALKYNGTAAIGAADMYADETYYASDFAPVVVTHGTDENLEVLGIAEGNIKTYDPEPEEGEAVELLGSVSPTAEDVEAKAEYTVVVSYTKADKTVDYYFGHYTAKEKPAADGE